MRAFAFVVLAFLIATSSINAQPPVIPSKKEKDKEKEPPRTGNPDDVPVVPTKKDEKPPAEKSPEKPEIISGEHAVLPASLVKNTIRALKSGNTTYVAVDAVRIDAKRKMWLHPTFITGAKTNDRPIQIRRDTEGYHIVLEQIEHQWEAEDVDGITSKWIPVKSVSVKE